MRVPLKYWAALGVVSALAAAGGIAYAKSTDSGPVIKACAKTQNGQLRIDNGGGCQPSEQAVQWNQVGPQGPPGNTDSTTRYISYFISDGETASIPVISAAGRLGTLSFTCTDLTYDTNPADEPLFADRVMFYSPVVPDSPLMTMDHLNVTWSSSPLNRPFQIMIEGLVDLQTGVTLTTITGWVKYFPQFSGCSYFAYMATADVRSPQTITP
jgi:hypothetical protein